MHGELLFLPVTEDAQIEETAKLANTIWHECFESILSPGQIDYMVDKFQSRHALTDQIKNNGYEYFLMCEGEAPIGYVGIQPKDDLLLLSKLYILDSHRGQGYARQAMGFVEEAARQRKCVGVWLTVNRHNERAIAVYRKTGFKLTREEKKDIGGGYVMDDYIFEKPI